MHARPADPVDIDCWQRITPMLTTSGRLTAADPARLAAIGVGTVINLALCDSPRALDDESERLAALNIAYVHVPVPFDAPEDRHFARFVDAISQADGQHVHVHCIRNWRVSAFLYRWHVWRGMEPEAARAIMLRQWDPSASDHPDAPAWARFVARV